MIPYHAAPTTDNPMHNPTPKSAQAYGDTSSRNCPTYSPISNHPADSSESQTYVESFTIASE
jgi:hypothetical protein